MASSNPPPSRSSSRVDVKAVEKVVNGLLKWRNSKSLTLKNPQLLEQDDFVYLVLTLKKIPSKDRINAYKIPLPCSLLDTNSSEFCLIIDDRPKSGLTKEAVEKKIQSENIPIDKIIKLSKLKSDYRAFEAKRKLYMSYDMFFADKRVIPLLPKVLGRHFFKKKKIPVPMDLKHKNWKEQIEEACGSAMLYLRTGTCSVIKVGKVSMGKEEIVENVMAAIDGIADVVPSKWGNVRSFHLKLLESLALPVYQAMPHTKLKIDGAKNEDEKETGELSRECRDKEENKKDGNMGKKGRIHKIRYVDHIPDDILNEDDLDSDDDELDETALVVKKRKKEGDKSGMKRKKEGDNSEGFLSELNEKKQARNTLMSKNEDRVQQRKSKLWNDEEVIKQKKDK